MGKVYYDMGFLATAEVLEISVTNLVGEYTGQTGPKTQKQLEKALGKVLFIDEAYRLADGHFAKEAMEEIVDCLTKPAFAQKLMVILAGYDKDINRLMSINPGLTSRFPETITFQSMDPAQSLDLLTKQLQRKKHLDGTLLKFPAIQFKQDIMDRFNTLVETPNWGNARDVGLLTKSIYGTLLKTANPESSDPMHLDETTVLHALDVMVTERTDRAKTGRSGKSSLPKFPEKLANLGPNTFSPPNSGSGKSTTPMHKTESFANKPVLDAQEPATKSDEPATKSDEPATKSDDPTTKLDEPTGPDPGVSKEIWIQLKLDEQAAVDMEKRSLELEAETARMKREADENEDKLRREQLKQEEETRRAQSKAEEEDAKRRFEQERLRREMERRKYMEALARAEQEKKRIDEERRKEQAVQKKLRHMGVCVQGFRWIKRNGGYQCAGGAHFVSDAHLGI